jgi:uncharacterized protein YjbI with pentapeptide repeats
MDPQVEAAVIAGVVSLVSLGGTVVVAWRGFHATKQVTADTLSAQREQLDRTIAEQHVRAFNERFATAADRLGADKSPAVRLAGVHAMAGLADDWEESRQTCVDVLCAYLRMPYEPYPGDQAPQVERLAYRADREVRHSVIRLISEHLSADAPVSWQGLNFDFSGAVFDGGNFDGAVFSSGKVSFFEAIFPDGIVRFDHAHFCGAEVDFDDTQIGGGKVWFGNAKFSAGRVTFNFTELSAGSLVFDRAEFSGTELNFLGGEFSGGTLSCGNAVFSGGRVWLGSKFCGATVWFGGTRFSGGQVWYSTAEFSGGEVVFDRALFSGSEFSFAGAKFSGGTVDLSGAADWSHPPAGDWVDTPPAGVSLPILSEAAHPGITATPPVILLPQDGD